MLELLNIKVTKIVCGYLSGACKVLIKIRSKTANGVSIYISAFTTGLGLHKWKSTVLNT